MPRDRSRSSDSRRVRDSNKRPRRRSRSQSRSRSRSLSRHSSKGSDHGRRGGSLKDAARRRQQQSRNSRSRSRSRSSSTSSTSHGENSSSRRKRSASKDVDKKKKKKHKKSSKKKKSRRETSEERQQRKDIQRREKERLKMDINASKESQIAEQMAASLGYSNKDNPFMDSNLNSKFVWVKKRQIEGKQGITSEHRVVRDKIKMEETKTELEKLKQKREERKLEQELREQEMLRMQREQDRAALGDWEAKEDEFHLNQAKVRAQIRIKEGRARAIDILAMNLSLATNSELSEEFETIDLDLEMMEEPPYTITEYLSLEEMKELYHDCQLYHSLETNEENKSFWQSMLLICDAEMTKRRESSNHPSSSSKSSSKATGAAAAAGVGKDILDDITRLLEGKTLSQLEKLYTEVESKLSGGGPVDVEYWEVMLKEIIVWKSKAKLKETHHYLLKKRLEILMEQGLLKTIEDGSTIPTRRKQPLMATLVSTARTADLEVAAARGGRGGEGEEDGGDYGEEDEEDEETGENGEVASGGGSSKTARLRGGKEEEPILYEACMSPLLLDEIAHEDKKLDIVDEEEDYYELMERRKAVMKERMRQTGRSSNQQEESPAVDSEAAAFERAFIENEMRHADEGEESMAIGDNPSSSHAAGGSSVSYVWQDKYRPRKPRYFNRVHTGFEWNKYNQTHYDPDNPPPKVVQGYKFNIFYPDLVDKSSCPTYKIQRDEGFPDTVILRFIAGPPYEDIAFRIVNKEWEHSHKNGFKSSFDRGVLQLHFRFKRQFYRR